MAPPAIVQTKVVDFGGGHSTTVTLNGVTGGNAILVLQTWLDATSSLILPTDGVNTYTQVGSVTQVNGASQACFVAANVAAGNTTITVSSVGNVNLTSWDIYASEISGADLVTPVESYTTATGTSAAPLSPSIATQHYTSLILGLCTITSSSISGRGNTFTLVTNGVGGYGYDYVYEPQAVKGDYQCQWATSGSTNWIAGTVVIGQPGTTMVSPSMVQLTDGAYAGTTHNFSFATNPTSGNFIFIAIFGGGITTISVSDGTNTYHQVGSTLSGPGGVRTLELFYAYNITGGALTITISNGTFDNVSYIAIEYSVVLTQRDPFDIEAHTHKNSAVLNSGNKPTTANDLKIAVFNTINGGVTSPTDGSTEIDNLSSGSFVVAHALTMQGQSISAVSTATSGQWIVQVVGFKFSMQSPIPVDTIFFGMT